MDNYDLCEDEGCGMTAGYTLKEHDLKLIYEKCMKREYKGSYVIKYYLPENLKLHIHQGVAMVRHIVKDCKLFKDQEIAKKISKEIARYEKKVDKILSKFNECVYSNRDEYRETSEELYEEMDQIKDGILNSHWCKRLYSENYIKYHLGDLSILSKEKDEDQPPRSSRNSGLNSSRSSEVNLSQSESGFSNSTEQVAELMSMIERLKEEFKEKEASLRK